MTEDQYMSVAESGRLSAGLIVGEGMCLMLAFGVCVLAAAIFWTLYREAKPTKEENESDKEQK